MGGEGSRLRLWGGLECTLNQVGETAFDQTRLSGHQDRPEDLDAFAELGIAALRYPALWERISPDRPDAADWAWTDERLGRLQSLGLPPILTLVHHGAGPRYASLATEDFAPGLARHAGAVARRYPWVTDWTPVNEPLTTARFSALYGHWRPHTRDERTFWLALLNEIDATRLAMRAIREVIPGARLVQTDDLGGTWSTPDLSDQADFDNQRRWMTWDLLFGRVNPEHRFWRRLCGMGFEERLKRILDDPCPPDVVGVNHYLTSDRFLDHRTSAYPAHCAGGNGRMAYADLEAVRVLDPGSAGLAGALTEAWDRYGTTLAVTELHNGCTREEQLRWLLEGWQTCVELREAGIAIEAATVWALLGSFNWNSLLTRDDGVYEPGPFDVRGPRPRPTALAALARSLASGDTPADAALGRGWWRRRERLLYRPVKIAPPPAEPVAHAARPRPLLITGASGTLGQAIARACRGRALRYVITDRRQLPLDDAQAVERALERIRPWAVINAAGFVRVDDGECETEACFLGNTQAAIGLAQACAARDIPLTTLSSDLVFDGELGRAYVESDPPAPLNVYGESKARAEAGVLAAHGGALVVRTAAFFSPHDPYNFAHHVSTSLREGRPFEAASDLVISPAYVPDLADAIVDLTIDRERGVWHLASGEALSWAEFAIRIAVALDLDPALVRPVPHAHFRWAARRPRAVGLATERGQLMPLLESAIARYAEAVDDEVKALVA